MQIGVLCTSKAISTRDLAFLTDAWDRQAKEFADDWGVPYTPVIYYSDVSELPIASGDVRLLTIADTIDAPGALGYHDNVLGLIFARVLARNNAEAATHEICEEEGDPECDLWMPMGDGREVAKEACDPVEADSYPQVAEVGGDRRQILVSNYVLPSWFDPNGTAPFDRMGLLTAPLSMTPGGYMIVRDEVGRISNVFAQGEKSHATMARKLAQPSSRLLRRLRG